MPEPKVFYGLAAAIEVCQELRVHGYRSTTVTEHWNGRAFCWYIKIGSNKALMEDDTVDLIPE